MTGIKSNAVALEMALKPAFASTAPVSIGVQSVLFNNELTHVGKSIESLFRSVELGVTSGVLNSVSLHLGDSSPIPCISSADLQRLRDKYRGAIEIRYDFFGGNLGSAGGHNRLAAQNMADFLLIQNPDVIVSPRLLETVVQTFRTPGVGMVEGKQLPIEHPKEYDRITGETCWATTACAMIPGELFRQLGGFDADCFFLYCDDVDFSWMVREAGYNVIFQPAAVVFHDKRLSPQGKWQPSNAEEYYSAEAALFMTYKWSRRDLTESFLKYFEGSNNPQHKKAAATFKKRRDSSALPQPRDPGHRIGQFIDGMYTKHRFPL
jgi:GT2 family glycosyltransferase